jgi:hypothetical protein
VSERERLTQGSCFAADILSGTAVAFFMPLSAFSMVQLCTMVVSSCFGFLAPGR